MERTVNFYISTGKKQVLHTLWEELIIPRPSPPGEPQYCAVIHRYIRNLPVDQDEALKAAKEWIAEYCPKSNFQGIEDSPRFKKAKFIDMYCMHFVQRRKNGKTFFMADYPTEDFWEAWKASKDDMRKAGFRVSKFEMTREKHTGRALREPVMVWYVFYSPEEV